MIYDKFKYFQLRVEKLYRILPSINPSLILTILPCAINTLIAKTSMTSSVDTWVCIVGASYTMQFKGPFYCSTVTPTCIDFMAMDAPKKASNTSALTLFCLRR